MSSKRTRSTRKVVKEVVDPSNPNIIERTYENPQSFPTSPTKKKRQESAKNSEYIGDEVDDVLYGGLNLRDTSGNQGREGSRARTWESLVRDPTRQGDDPRAPPTGFLSDAQAGTPMDFFNFDAMKRHLERLVQTKTAPLSIFIGGVAAHTNQPEESFYENGIKPSFLNPEATNLKQLLTTSGMSAVVLVQLMTEVIVDRVSQAIKKEIELGRTGKDEPLPPDAKPIARDDDILVYSSPGKRRLYVVTREERLRQGLEDPFNTPPGSPRLQPDLVDLASPQRRDQDQQQGIVLYQRANSKIGSSINGSIEWLGMIQQDHQSQLIGPNLFGGDGEGYRPENGADFLQEMRMILGEFVSNQNQERWLWNSMPENSGILVVSNSLRAMIEEAWRNIQKLPGKSEIKIYHLMTSPEVRTKFAAYVASLLNVTPGMSLAPGIIAGSGRVIGYRAGQGLIKDQRYANLGRAAYLWFKTVNYRKNPEVTDAEDHVRRIDTEIMSLTQEKLQDKRGRLLRSMIDVWNGVSNQVKYWAAVQSFFEDTLWMHLQRKSSIEERTINDQRDEGDQDRIDDNNLLIETNEKIAYFKRLRPWMKTQVLEWIRTEDRRDPSDIEIVMFDHFRPWINILGTNTAGIENVARFFNPGMNAGDPIPGIQGYPRYWQVYKTLPQLRNWNNQNLTGLGIQNNIPSSIMGDRVEYASAVLSLDQLASGTNAALSQTTVWRNPPPELSEIRKLAYEVKGIFEDLHRLRKSKLDAEKFLATVSENDRVVLTKNPPPISSRFSGRLKMVPTADDMEGYFPVNPTIIPPIGINWKKVPMFRQGFF